VEKKDAVVSGRFKMTMFGHSAILEAGDCLLVNAWLLSSTTLLTCIHCSPSSPRWRAQVPAGAIHTAEVVGDEPVVSLDSEK
jgi:hypothetical protein